VKHIKTDSDQYVVVIGEKICQFDSTHESYNKLVDCINYLDESGFLRYYSTGENIHEWSEGNFNYSHGVLKYVDYEIPSSLTQVIEKHIAEKSDYKPMLNFIERLIKNPSARALKELYNFIVLKGLSIDKDGYIVAFKGVNQDYTDCHTGTVSNVVGSIHSMTRNTVDDDWGKACSEGFHVGTREFATSFGKKVVIVKLDPADFVATDGISCKMRCCKYEVIGEDVPEQPDPSPVYDYNPHPECEDLDDDDDYEPEDKLRGQMSPGFISSFVISPSNYMVNEPDPYTPPKKRWWQI
jgi:hypothetical protein